MHTLVNNTRINNLSLDLSILSKEMIYPCVTIPLLDILLCRMISNKARWFQLHSVVNLVILFIISSDVKKYYIDLFQAIELKSSNLDNYFIIVLHIYHCLSFHNLKFLDYFHHILFILTGVFPCTFILKTNISRLITFTGCGFPGLIEYTTLVMMKHEYLTPLQQKNINSYMYTYVRTPLTIFNTSFIFIAYHYGYFSYENIYVLFYVATLTYFNGTFYNKLAVENYRDTYNNKYLKYDKDIQV
jgi:hypothetical protein